MVCWTRGPRQFAPAAPIAHDDPTSRQKKRKRPTPLCRLPRQGERALCLCVCALLCMCVMVMGVCMEKAKATEERDQNDKSLKIKIYTFLRVDGHIAPFSLSEPLKHQNAVPHVLFTSRIFYALVVFCAFFGWRKQALWPLAIFTLIHLLTLIASRRASS